MKRISLLQGTLSNANLEHELACAAPTIATNNQEVETSSSSIIDIYCVDEKEELEEIWDSVFNDISVATSSKWFKKIPGAERIPKINIYADSPLPTTLKTLPSTEILVKSPNNLTVLTEKLSASIPPIRLRSYVAATCASTFSLESIASNKFDKSHLNQTSSIALQNNSTSRSLAFFFP